MVLKKIRRELPTEALVFDNPSFDNSIIGISNEGKVIYEYELMVEELMNDDNISIEDAIDFIDYNTLRSISYQGEKAPIVMFKF